MEPSSRTAPTPSLRQAADLFSSQRTPASRSAASSGARSTRAPRRMQPGSEAASAGSSKRLTRRVLRIALKISGFGASSTTSSHACRARSCWFRSRSAVLMPPRNRATGNDGAVASTGNHRDASAWFRRRVAGGPESNPEGGLRSGLPSCFAPDPRPPHRASPRATAPPDSAATLARNANRTTDRLRRDLEGELPMRATGPGRRPVRGPASRPWRTPRGSRRPRGRGRASRRDPSGDRRIRGSPSRNEGS